MECQDISMVSSLIAVYFQWGWSLNQILSKEWSQRNWRGKRVEIQISSTFKWNCLLCKVRALNISVCLFYEELWDFALSIKEF